MQILQEQTICPVTRAHPAPNPPVNFGDRSVVFRHSKVPHPSTEILCELPISVTWLSDCNRSDPPAFLPSPQPSLPKGREEFWPVLGADGAINLQCSIINQFTLVGTARPLHHHSGCIVLLDLAIPATVHLLLSASLSSGQRTHIGIDASAFPVWLNAGGPGLSMTVVRPGQHQAGAFRRPSLAYAPGAQRSDDDDADQGHDTIDAATVLLGLSGATWLSWQPDAYPHGAVLGVIVDGDYRVAVFADVGASLAASRGCQPGGGDATIRICHHVQAVGMTRISRVSLAWIRVSVTSILPTPSTPFSSTPTCARHIYRVLTCWAASALPAARCQPQRAAKHAARIVFA